MKLFFCKIILISFALSLTLWGQSNEEFSDDPFANFPSYSADTASTPHQDSALFEIQNNISMDYKILGQVLRQDEGFNRDNNSFGLREVSDSLDLYLSTIIDHNHWLRFNQELRILSSNANTGQEQLGAQNAKHSVGFHKLTVETQLDAFNVIIGREAIPSKSVSFFQNPSNYIIDEGSFFHTQTSWQSTMNYSGDLFSINLSYLPVFHAVDSTTEKGHFLSSFNSVNQVQFLYGNMGMFLDNKTINVFAYIKEKKVHQPKEDLLFAGGLNFAMTLSSLFRVYGEGLYGSGMRKLETLEKIQSLDPLAPKWNWSPIDEHELNFKSLTGVAISPMENFDIHLEYRYDNSAFNSTQLKRLENGLDDYYRLRSQSPAQGLFWQGVGENEPYRTPFTLSQHIFCTGVLWRNIHDQMDMNTLWFVSLSDASSMLIPQISYRVNENYSLYFHQNHTFKSFVTNEQGAFALLPFENRYTLGVKIGF